VAEYGATAGTEAEPEPDLEEIDRVARIYRRWQDARDGLNQWRSEAREDYDFDACQQWSADDLAKLEEQERPSTTFNRGSVIVDAVCGLEVTTRQQVTYFPREQGDVQVSEIETAAAQWVNEQTHGEDEESEAFRDATICGIGCTEMRMDYESEPDGKIVKERRDPLTMFWDPAARKKCLEDRRYQFHADWMDNREIDAKWPGKTTVMTPWDRLDEGQRPQNADLQFLYKDTDADFEKHKDQSLVIHYQSYEREPLYRVLDPQSGQLVSFDEPKFKKIRAAYKEATGEDLKFVKQLQRVYYRGFYCGRTELEYGKSPCQEGFTFNFITFKRDRNRRQWYGLWRAMKDPQRWANKWLSQILHIINTNAKGGAFVETNALKDPRKAEEQWASSNPLIEVNEGGIQKIKERQPANTPTGLDKLMTFAFESMPFVSGVNLEALGLANREQAGVLEAQRRKSAYGILAPLFDALRLYRKQQGKMLLYFIREYISDGRLIKVLGAGGQQKYLPLIRKPDTVEYDLIVDQAPTSPDFREKTWEAMKEILPVMMKEGIPIPPSVFDFAPIPSSVAMEFKQLMASRGQIPPQVQQQMQQMQQAIQKLGQENQQLKQENLQQKVDASVEVLKIQAKHMDAQQRNVTKDKAVELDALLRSTQQLIDASAAKTSAQIEAFAKVHIPQKDQHLKAVETGLTHIREMIALKNQAQPPAPPIVQVHVDGKGKVTKKIGKAVKNKDGTYSLTSEERVE